MVLNKSAEMPERGKKTDEYQKHSPEQLILSLLLCFCVVFYNRTTYFASSAATQVPLRGILVALIGIMHVCQWGTDSWSFVRKKGLLEKDVQVSKCCQWHQQSVRTGHIRVHHCSLGHHHGPPLTLALPTHLTAQEAQTSHRYAFIDVRCS